MPVTPASDTAILTTIFILLVLEQVEASGKHLKVSSKSVFFSASAREYTLIFNGSQTATRGE